MQSESVEHVVVASEGWVVIVVSKGGVIISGDDGETSISEGRSYYADSSVTSLSPCKNAEISIISGVYYSVPFKFSCTFSVYGASSYLPYASSNAYLLSSSS